MILVLGIIGLTSGIVTAVGLFCLVTTVGVVNRFASVTKSEKYINLYEEFIIAGASFANLIYMLGVRFESMGILALVFCLVSGMFVGTFLISLAESIKGLPILMHRAQIIDGLGFIAVFIAFGKMCGQLLYYLYLY